MRALSGDINLKNYRQFDLVQKGFKAAVDWMDQCPMLRQSVHEERHEFSLGYGLIGDVTVAANNQGRCLKDGIRFFFYMHMRDNGLQLVTEPGHTIIHRPRGLGQGHGNDR